MSKCFQPDKMFENQAKTFLKTLNNTFQPCFNKVRISNKTNNTKKGDSEIESLLEIKTELQLFVKTTNSEISILVAKKNI